MEGTAKATQYASIFAYPNQAQYENRYSVGPGESVQLLGQAAAPWDDWLYVHREQPDLTGFVWGPFFEVLPKLELTSFEKKTFCDAQKRERFGFQVQITGGNGDYTFRWGDLSASVVEILPDGAYLVSWSWEDVALKVGELTVLSGDGQEDSTPALDFIGQKPSCD
jgi:hypothetical protein